MIRRGFLGLLFGGGFVYFLRNLYSTPESAYIDSVSKGEVNNELHVRFVSDEDKRAEMSEIRTVLDETVYATTSIDARLPRMSVGYPPDEEYRLEVIGHDETVLEIHDLENIQA